MKLSLDEIIWIRQKEVLISFQEVGICKILSETKISKDKIKDLVGDKKLQISRTENDITNQKYCDDTDIFNNGDKIFFDVLIVKDIANVIKVKALVKNIQSINFDDFNSSLILAEL